MLFNYPILFIFSSVHYCAYSTQARLWHKSSSFLLQQFCATLLPSVDSQDLAFDSPGIRQNNCPIVMRHTPILREQNSLCKVPMTYWVNQSLKVFSWHNASTLPTGAKLYTIHWAALYTSGWCPIYYFSFEVFSSAVLSLIPQFLKRLG